MKLEVGMYVRTDEGMAKVINKRKNPYGEETIFMIDKPFIYHFADFLKTSEDMIDVNFEEDTSQIKGASHNIIDLIEVGDYVNGYYIEDIEEVGYEYDNGFKANERVLRTNIIEFDNIYPIGRKGIRQNEIKSIVTKEQFSAMEYKLGDE